MFPTKYFPIGLQANDLQLSEYYWNLGETIQQIITLVNQNGGWTILGWYSRGVINDRTLTGVITNSTSSSTISTQNNEDIQVDGADITYHFCKIVPTDSLLLDASTFFGQRYHNLLYNVSEIHSA